MPHSRARLSMSVGPSPGLAHGTMWWDSQRAGSSAQSTQTPSLVSRARRCASVTVRSPRPCHSGSPSPENSTPNNSASQARRSSSLWGMGPMPGISQRPWGSLPVTTSAEAAARAAGAAARAAGAAAPPALRHHFGPPVSSESRPGPRSLYAPYRAVGHRRRGSSDGRVQPRGWWPQRSRHAPRLRRPRRAHAPAQPPANATRPAPHPPATGRPVPPPASPPAPSRAPAHRTPPRTRRRAPTRRRRPPPAHQHRQRLGPARPQRRPRRVRRAAAIPWIE